jgi:hypothetical protein
LLSLSLELELIDALTVFEKLIALSAAAPSCADTVAPTFAASMPAWRTVTYSSAFALAVWTPISATRAKPARSSPAHCFVSTSL